MVYLVLVAPQQQLREWPLCPVFIYQVVCSRLDTFQPGSRDVGKVDKGLTETPGLV